MVAISRCLGSLALFLAGAEGARISRKHSSAGSKVLDCYSKYDGKTLLHLTPCTSAELGEISSHLESLGCTLVDDEFEVPQTGCADAEAVCSGEAAATLQQLGSVSISSSDAGAHWRESSGVAQPFTEGFGVASDFYSEWRDLDARMARVESAVQASGGIATIETAGKSLEGRDIKIVRFTGRGYISGDPKVFLTFNLHAREWIGGMSGIYAIEQLVAKARQDPDYLAGVEVVMMPMANPDGFLQSSNNDRMHRKNMRKVSSSCYGVDVNRNFDAHWATGGSSGSACSDTYHGTAAMSEPESNVIAQVMNESPMAVYIDVHAYSQLILEAYGWTRANHPRREAYSNIGQKIQTAIQSRHGIRFTEGPIAQVLYVASGSSVDYADDRGALGLCFELRPGRYGGGGFAPPASSILPAAEECYDGILAAVDYAKNPPAPTPTPPPTPAPPSICPSETSSGPDNDGDCRCNSGLACYENGSRGCTYSYTASSGYTSNTWFLPSCSDCRCQSR